MGTLHLELTNRCILSCPACPRTEWSELLKKPLPKKDLNYLDLDAFLDCPGGRNITDFVLCGDYGDCIYYPNFFEFLEHYRSNKKFKICTNGSRQPASFWQRLSELSLPGDEIVFGIDGLEDTNHLYRRNSHWPSIIEAVEIMSKSQARVSWQTIVFKFNQHRLNEIKNFAESKGANFFSIMTHRFGDDSLMPDRSMTKVKFQKSDEYIHKSFEVVPQCKISDVIPTVGADGIFYPCDWIRNPNVFYKSQLWKQKDRWIDKLNINSTNYDQAMAIIKDWADSVRHNSLNNGPVDYLCKMKCRSGI